MKLAHADVCACLRDKKTALPVPKGCPRAVFFQIVRETGSHGIRECCQARKPMSSTNAEDIRLQHLRSSYLTKHKLRKLLASNTKTGETQSLICHLLCTLLSAAKMRGWQFFSCLLKTFAHFSCTLIHF